MVCQRHRRTILCAAAVACVIAGTLAGCPLGAGKKASAEPVITPIIATEEEMKAPAAVDESPYYRTDILFAGRSFYLTSQARPGEPSSMEMRDNSEGEGRLEKLKKTATDFVAVSPDGSKTARSTPTDMVYIYKRGRGGVVIGVSLRAEGESPGTRVLTCAGWSDNNRYVALGYAGSASGGGVLIIDTESGNAAFHDAGEQPLLALPASDGALACYSVNWAQGNEGAYSRFSIYSPAGESYQLLRGEEESISQAKFLDGGKRIAIRAVDGGVATVTLFDLERGAESPATGRIASMLEKAATISSSGFTAASDAWEVPPISVRIEAANLEKERVRNLSFKAPLPADVGPLQREGGRTGIMYDGMDLDLLGLYRTEDGAVLAMQDRHASKWLVLAYVGRSGELTAGALVPADRIHVGSTYSVWAVNYGYGAFFRMTSDECDTKTAYLTRAGRIASADGDWMVGFQLPSDERYREYSVYPLSDGGCMAVIMSGLDVVTVCMNRFTRAGRLVWSRSMNWPSSAHGNTTIYWYPSIGLDGDEIVAAFYHIDPLVVNHAVFRDERRESSLVFVRVASNGGGLRASRLGMRAIDLEQCTFTWQAGAFRALEWVLKPEYGRYRIINLGTSALAGHGGMNIVSGSYNILLAWAKKYTDNSETGTFSGMEAWSSDLKSRWLLKPQAQVTYDRIPRNLVGAIDASGLGVFAFPSNGSYGGLPKGSIALFRAPLGAGGGWNITPIATHEGILESASNVNLKLEDGLVSAATKITNFTVRHDVPDLHQVVYRGTEDFGK
jgi:hypothetical protein